ncbi:replication factor C subunit 2 [Globomyces pollinis-pini]|nr:replication factor C subunit 2 [Globomyces pollinis-pini]
MNSNSQNIQPWVEKYRPNSLNEMVAQDDCVQTLARSVSANNLPHLLFYGPPGTGKTSAILALAKDLYGKDLFKQRVLELNASDERGIDVVRTKIKDFAKLSITSTSNSPPFKLIILDEADSMTVDAQAALRRTMETYSKVTRFCLICNYITRIIEPLVSRCAKFRFKPLPIEPMVKRLDFICTQEDINCNTNTLTTLVKVVDGDLRQAITLLQTAKRMGTTDEITQTDIEELIGAIPDHVIQKLFQTWQTKNVTQINQTLQNIFKSGYSGLDLILKIHSELVNPTSTYFNAIMTAKIMVELGRTEKRLLDGADEHLQCLQLMCTVE